LGVPLRKLRVRLSVTSPRSSCLLSVGFPLQSLTRGSAGKGVSGKKKIYQLIFPVLIMANSP